MQSFPEKLLDEDLLIPILAITCGTLIALIAIVTSCIRSVAVGRAREQTKREMAAYVAEGTIDPDKAVAMLNAGRTVRDANGNVVNAAAKEA